MSYHSVIGKEAPAIILNNYDGESFTFTAGASGLPTVLFFYPASGVYMHYSLRFSNKFYSVLGTYGCTKEACQFRDAIAEKDTFKTGSVQIIGISPDPVEKQKQFVEKEKLTVSTTYILPDSLRVSLNTMAESIHHRTVSRAQ